MLEDQLIRYSRNIKLDEVGIEGQKKLLSSKVLVIGAGGLGSPVLLYLAAAGVGTLGIIDNDRVEVSNLQRQVIHETSDIGRKKSESASDAILDLNPDINVGCYNCRLDESNVTEIISKYDVIADCSDNFETRFLVNDTCLLAKKTLVSAAINRFEGQLSTFKAYLGGENPCYRCIYHAVPPDDLCSCADLGVIGGVAGIIGTWQAMEVIKEILEIGDSLSGYLVIFDALTSTSRKIKVHPDKMCKCG